MARVDKKSKTVDLSSLAHGIPIDPLPEMPLYDPHVSHAPKRTPHLEPHDVKLALKNALRYFPSALHERLGAEFLAELRQYGHIYMYRFRPTAYEVKAHPIDAYPAKCRQAAAIMHMIMNNLDPQVAQHPHELITYGGNGTVFSNWAQYHLTMYYLCHMDEDQTLAMYSGHPAGLQPSSRDAPRVVVTNGMVIPNYSSKEEYERLCALGVTMYGQMTAGSYCYIGPQGIVHGTTLTILNACRKYYGAADLAGKVYLSSGLGGMSGAQAKAAVICGAIGVLAEVDPVALDKRHAQGWVQEKIVDLQACVDRIREARAARQPLSIGFLGNVVALWERLAQEPELLVEMGSDQTSLHNPYNGGYYPVQLTFEESRRLMADDPEKFKQLVQESLRRHVAAVNTLVAKGMHFWDYGNCFLLESSRAGADILDAAAPQSGTPIFKYPSYVEHVMGDIFSLGFGPFRWVCTSGNHADLQTTDAIAARVFERLLKASSNPIRAQFEDNLHWIQKAEENRMVVGSEARILYSDAQGRVELALAFNEAIKNGEISGPIALSRDHHDVSGTDSPFRETSNIRDGSSLCADMAIQNVIGGSFRGATWVAIHNGGGVGWGEVVNGGFGLVLDGSDDAGRRAASMLSWDVTNGVSRRAWAGNANAVLAVENAHRTNPKMRLTLPHLASDEVLDRLTTEKNKI